MTLLRHWAYTLCIGSILLAVLRGILPVKNMTSVIKLVLSLYILLMLLAPVSNLHVGAVLFDGDNSKVPPIESVDIKKAVQSETEELLEQELLHQLEQNGISVCEAILTSNISDKNEFCVESVTLYVTGALPDTVLLENSLHNAFGILPKYEVLQVDGTANETGL